MPETNRTKWLTRKTLLITLLTPPDAVSVLTIYLVLLFVIPSDRGIGALGGAGSVAGVFALATLLWWCWHHIQSPGSPRFGSPSPVRTAMFVFLGAVLASFAVASISALPAPDANAADLGLLRAGSFAGVLLVANDGIPDKERFLTLMRRLALLGGLYAALGALQFYTGQSFTDAIQIPGLTTGQFEGVDARGGFVRPEATARQPLEYAAVLTMLLPIALTLAIHDHKSARLVRWFPVAAMTLAIFLSVSRSAFIGAVAVLAVLLPTWAPKVRRAAAWALAFAFVAVYVLVPGMVGTVLGLFTVRDASVDSRTDGYDIAGEFVAMNPLLGRGFGTFLPSYRILDNQYVGMLIELGAIGVVTFAAVLAVGAGVAFAGRRLHHDHIMTQMGPALGASVLVSALLAAFFDALSFAQAAGLMFLMSGLSGAYWHLGAPTRRIAREGA
ncbi:O-antigen ligase family protein [Crystallibacter degradans]|uniref:O-antigen ligase family protein n=1 Tax=Crystallibacter degradans TaxID=2726743 RepID=UPI0014766C13|nr:O-antigen ligase family protein [Arthrobacter sp. SF27]NMR28210.1 O-antigen ligase family protein [Arthrobacter sp. SF27]